METAAARQERVANLTGAVDHLPEDDLPIKAYLDERTGDLAQLN